MISVDLEQFWKDDQLAHVDNCFCEKSPQVALGIRMSDECVFAELGEEGDPWGTPLEPERRAELNKRYNDKAERIVGKRLLSEHIPDKEMKFPPIRRIGEVFEGTYEMDEKTGEWLHSSISTPEQLEEMLDRVDKLDLREFMLPPNWEFEKKRIYECFGKKPELLRGIRGPVTLAMSIYGAENLIFLFYDEPDLYKRFSDTICRVILSMGKIMEVEAGVIRQNAPGGFYFADDNCSLLNTEMYESFGYPILQKVFEYFSPNPSDMRYQHSDSDMGHLLPILGKLNLTGCNFGPNVLVDQIRKYMPLTSIDGCICPISFMNNNQEEIVKQAKRDCQMIKLTNTKGLNLTTAGSISNGSSLESMRLVMHVIQNYGRY